MGYKTIIIDSFPKGITDKPEDGDIRAAQKLDNVNLRDNSKLETRPGSWIHDDLSYRTINELDAKLVLEYGTESLFVAGGKVYLNNGTTFAEVEGANPAIDIFPEADNDTFYSSFEWKDQFVVTSDAISRPVKIYKEDTNGWTIISAGLPALASGATGAITGGAGSGSYILGFCHKYSYEIDDIEYTMRGPVTNVQIEGASGGTINYTGIPELVNGADTHYDVANIEIEIYRTLYNGIILYLDKTITNGTTNISSTTTDADIIANQRIYTDGGVLDSDPPPKCKYVMQAQNYAYYLGVTGDTSKGIESKPSEIDAAPAGNYFKIDKALTGGGVIFNNFYVFANDLWYILQGHYTTQGAGGVIPRIISNTEGVLYNNSFVNTTYGAVAFGQNSFVFCDGNKVTPISSFNELYKKLASNSSDSDPVTGTFDPLNKRVYFTCKNKSESEQNDTIYSFHERLWSGGFGAFTTWSGGKYFNPRYIQWLKSNKLFRSDAGGWLLVHDDSYKYDPVYKDSSLPSSWQKIAVKEDVITSYIYGDNPSIRKWGCKMLFRAKNLTNLSIQPSCSTDGSSNFKPMNKIDIRTQITWGEEHIYWDETPNIYWKDTKDIQRMINMPSGFARFSSRQLRFEKALSIIYMPSQGYANDVTIDATNGLVTFNGEVPSNLLDRYLLVEPYNELYLIIQQTDTSTYKLSNPNSTLVDGTYNWIVKGYPLYQIFSPLEMIMYYVDFGESQSDTNPQGITNTR